MTTQSPLFVVLLVLHVVAGTAAVVVGLVPLAGIKGGAFHRRWGRHFLRAMIVVLGTAACMTAITLNPYFAGLTASALVTTFSGWRVLRRKRPDLDVRQRATALDWLVTGVGAAVALVLLWSGHTGRITSNLAVVFSLAYGTLAYVAWDIMRFIRPIAWPFGPHLWLYEHIVKIIGAYFATVAAFSGSVLVFLPPPWKQLWAVSLGQFLAIVFVLRFRNDRRRAALGLSQTGSPEPRDALAGGQ